MLKKIAIVVIALVAALLLVVATRPSHFHVERSVSVAAAPEVVFPLINDFHAWLSWNPWEKLDPSMRREHSGPPQGKGAAYAWSGNSHVGVGSMLITYSQPPERVQIRLEFREPLEATNVATLRITPESGGSRVTWAMDGENNFLAKAVSLFLDMDQMIGTQFESGLSDLRNLAEARAAEPNAVAGVAPGK